VEGMSVLDMIQTGWIATYPLIAFSVITMSIIFERAWSLRNLVTRTSLWRSRFAPRWSAVISPRRCKPARRKAAPRPGDCLRTCWHATNPTPSSTCPA